MNRFNIRVYGILLGENKRVLVSDEFIRGNYYTKFPGGGLEFGEGTRDCLKREFKEEMNLDVTIGDHLYTTDFFQMSAFNPDHQIISIYYFAHASESIKFSLRVKPFDFNEQLSTSPPFHLLLFVRLHQSHLLKYPYLHAWTQWHRPPPHQQGHYFPRSDTPR